jgi:HlyD family secretion protein
MALASLQTAEADLSKTTIYSPLDGTVSKLNSQLGERVVGTAMMAGTEIMTIADLNTMEARVDVGEVDVVLIACGEKVQLDVDSFKDKKFNGFVTDVANSANNNDTSSAASTSTTTDATKFQVKIRVTEKEAFLPGMSVTANIETRSRTNALSVPIQSVTTRLPVAAAAKTNSLLAGGLSTNQTTATGKTNETTATGKTNETPAIGTTNDIAASGKTNEVVKPIEVVFLVEGDHAKSAPVKRGISDDNYTEITEGLQEGAVVVSGGYKAINHDLEDGKKVVLGAAAGAVKPKTASN